ncbi:PepSY domain-containing protein [Shewanella sp. AS1]|uniref:PepSY domain-containing protein n=1 Tax=Shewanella sp. AS1 TaxID=2907626 RepID=UPI001F17BB19|nr:PepSY domain-containing protein [Shewanella sp. AS1]MCE9678500.1 PepSY domain-containing protein [Shewanella sp. AS1]
MSIVRKTHKWASIFVGLQFLIWLGTGLYFNLMDHTKAAGHSYRAHLHPSLDWSSLQLQEPSAVLKDSAPSTRLKLIELAQKPYYLLNHERGLYAHFVNSYSLVDAVTGKAVSIDTDFARTLARDSYNGPGEIISVNLMEPPIADFLKQKNAAWQVNFNDEVNTSVYVEADSGRIVGHSDDDKRLADFFLKLHFMDYANQGSFNNLFMMLFAFVALFLSGTGLYWTVDLLKRGQYKIPLFAGKNRVNLFDSNQKNLGERAFSSHKNLLDGLVDHNIILPSTCGGGGTCGRCRIRLDQSVSATTADREHFSASELAQGYCLACQHFSDNVEKITLLETTAAKKYQLALVSSTFISPFIKELRFKALTKEPIEYKAGAFMRFMIPKGSGHSVPTSVPGELQAHWQEIVRKDYEHGACSRSYSLASIDALTQELVFVIKLQSAKEPSQLPGIGSNYLGNLSVGDRVEVLGPFEEFYAKHNSDKSMVLVGAGSGMAPLKALIEEQLTRYRDHQAGNPPRQLHFFYGARSEHDLIYLDYFYQLAKLYPQFHYYPILSRPDDAWLGATGYAQDVVALNWQQLLENGPPEFYLCGPKGLMADTIGLLGDKGVPQSHIAFDDFS